MASLSGRYAAGSQPERVAILAAGEAMFTLFNENAFPVNVVLEHASVSLLDDPRLLRRDRAPPRLGPADRAGALDVQRRSGRSAYLVGPIGR